MLERTYIIPLRRIFTRVPPYKRAKRCVNAVREFLSKHMKSKEIKLGQQINLLLWKRGIKNPPGQIKITAIKDDKGIVKAELFGHKYVEKKVEKKVEKSKLEQLKEKITGEDKKAEHNKEAIENVPEHKTHDHTAKDHSKELKSVDEKDMKVSSGKQKAQDKSKQ
ncbi:50S ribosomal protein L31e [Candidatus Woesearchaeota archaeon]|nr:50S ribosomal protein L31e [Candidatus Woesearchaeota archaeon]